MLFLFKYRFLQIVRDLPIMFWALAFPLILATLFYFSFGRAGLSATGESAWEAVKVCVIDHSPAPSDNQGAGPADSSAAFSSFLRSMDGDALKILPSASEKEALQMLDEGTISGIYYVSETPSLTVGKNGLNESILTTMLDTYNQNAAIFKKIAETHPENLPAAIQSSQDYQQLIRETTLGGETLDPNVQYFFALIAYACLSGAFLGVRASFDSQANLTALGARRSVTPTHKLTLILIDLLVLVTIHFANIMILTIYIGNVLGISLGTDYMSLLLVNFMGSLIGITMGLAFGSLTKLSLNIKMSLTVVLTLFPSFFAGLMFANMKNIMEQHVPFINRINPAAVLSDAYYCMGVYQDMDRFARCIATLAIMSILFLTAAFLGVRRERYDSI